MSYSVIAILAVIASGVLDIFVVKSDLLKKRVFWTSYAIILPFQLLTNWWLTSRDIVVYSKEAIIDWRIAAAPVEDLLFGFSLLLGVLSMWIYWGRKGLQ